MIDLTDAEKREISDDYWRECKSENRGWENIPPMCQSYRAAQWRKQHPAPTPPPRDPELVTHTWLKTFMEQYTDALGDRLKEVHGDIAKLDDGAANRLAALEKRCAELEQKALNGYDRGIWREDDAYQKGDWVTHDGALWIVQRAAKGERPGKSDAYRLAVKAIR